MPRRRSKAAAQTVRRRRVFWTIAASVALLFTLLGSWVQVTWLEKLDWDLRDALQDFLTTPPLPNEFVLVAIDEASLDLDQTVFPEALAASPTLQTMSQSGYPWPRSVYADLIEKLLAAGARKVVFDLLFTGPRAGDETLAKTLSNHPDQVVLGINFDQSTNTPQLKSNSILSLPSISVLPEADSRDTRLGFVNFWADPDQVVRAAVHRYESGGRVYSSLALRSVEGRREFPQSAVNQRSYFHFANPGAIPTIPFWQIFDPATWQANLENGAVFRDKIVWVGPTAQRFHDEVMTPISVLPGPVLHILSAAALLNRSTYELAPLWLNFLLTITLAFLAMSLIRGIPRPFIGMLAVLGLCVLYLPVAGAIWEWGHLSLALLFPMAALFFTGLLCFGYDFAIERRERSRTRHMLDRYVSRDLVRAALDHDETFLDSLNGSRRDVVVLFSDIRGFTTWSEKIEPEELVAQLNEYLSEMVAIVFENEGSVDKFVGDAVMAVWGTLGTHSSKQNALLATRAALAMQHKVAELNERWARESRQTIRIGIGLHAGPAIFGNIGSEQKMEPTIIGDTVNVASRVEGLCKKLSADLILTAPVAAAIQPEFEVVSLNTMPLAGRQAEIEVFTLKVLDRKPR